MLPLELSSAEFEVLGRRVLREAGEYLSSLGERPSFPSTSGAETVEAFGLPLPEVGVGAAVFDDLASVAAHSRAGNGRFFAYVLGSGEPVAALGDLYASVLNQTLTAWRSAPAAVTIERVTVGWLAEALGCPAFTGSLTGGGSSGILMGLAMARESVLPANEVGARPAVVYASDEVHMAVPKAVALLGLGRENLRLIPVDADFRIRVDALEEAVAEDRRAGKQAVAVVASAGTITTGAIDPLREVARVARENDLWLHVDGAYGVPAALAVPERFDGLDLADSISFDPHKWLYQPVDCSVLLFRDAAVARTTFGYTDDYARSLREDEVERFAFFEESIELSRRFRALKLWLSLRYHGFAAFREAIRNDLAHAELLAELVDAEPSLERLAPVELSAVCFRWNDGHDPSTLDQRNQAILQVLINRGNVVLSNATVRGAFALRACVVNHRTTDKDIATIIEEVRAATAATA